MVSRPRDATALLLCERRPSRTTSVVPPRRGRWMRNEPNEATLIDPMQTPVSELQASTRSLAEMTESYGRPPPPVPGRPFVRLNMVASADGAATHDGTVAQLTGPDDQFLFGELRSLSDLVLVGAATVRRERYGPIRLSEAQSARRARLALPPFPRLAVVTDAFDFDLTLPLFASHEPRPLLIATGTPTTDAIRRMRKHADVIVGGRGRVDFGTLFETFAEQGIEHVLAEGGPTVATQLLHDDLVDELCLTIAPRLVGAEQPRISHGLDLGQKHLTLRSVWESSGSLFIRYVVGPQRTSPGT